MSEAGAGRVEWLARCLGSGNLAPVERDDVSELAGAFDERRYAGGTCIFREGEILREVSAQVRFTGWRGGGSLGSG